MRYVYNAFWHTYALWHNYALFLLEFACLREVRMFHTTRLNVMET